MTATIERVPDMTLVGLQRDRYHRYRWNGSDPMVGVTTPLKIQDTLIGGDLAAWGAGIALDEIERQLSQGDEMFMDRSRALDEVAKARNIGTAVHARIEHILVGEPQSQVPCPRHPPEFGRVGACALLPELVPPYIYAFSSFLAEHRPQILFVEFMVVNLIHRFAGTGDIACILVIDGKRYICCLDVKSGKAKKTHKLQLAGLTVPSNFIGEPGNPEPIRLPKFQRYYTLLLSPTGYELVQHDVTAKDRRHFLNLVRTYRSLRDWESQ